MEEISVKQSTYSISSKQHDQDMSYDSQLMSRLPLCWPIASEEFGKPLENVVAALNNRKEPSRSFQNIERMREALVRNEDLRRMIDSRLTKSMAIENLLMEDKIKNLSRFVLPESFDLGLSRYYSRVAHQVNSELRARGLQLEENPKLKQEKDRWMKRKLQLTKEKHSQESQKHCRNGRKLLAVSSTKLGKAVSFPSLKQQSPTYYYGRMNARHKKDLKKHPQSPEHSKEMFLLTDLG